jgi:DNA-binding NarL/FixJ family response regulator
MICVAIVDDHPIARLGLASVLSEVDGFSVVAAVDGPNSLREQLTTTPDVLLLDLYHDGRPCVDDVLSLSSTMRVLVMSVSDAPQDVLGAIRAGARGYITKRAQPDQFATAVETVAEGGFWLSPNLADIPRTQLVALSPGQLPTTSNVRLSPREEQALDLIARGLTHAQAATRMGVSKTTVDTYVERIRAKLHIGNKADLTRAALLRLKEHRRPSTAQ